MHYKNPVSTVREATFIFVLIVMGFSVFGNNLSFQNDTESISKQLACYPQDSASLQGNNITVDTICTSTSRDTLYINSVEKATAYEWSLPSGAFIFKQLQDTAIIVDWSNAALGLSNICVTAQNACGDSNNSCLEVFIEECNTQPVATDDFEITTFNTPITIHVQTNDRDPNGDELTTLLDSTAMPNHGTLSILKLAVIYTPEQNFIGIDSFRYIICDNNHPSLCDTAQVRVTVDHQAPIAEDDMATTNANAPILIPVQENDSDPESGALLTFLDSLNFPLNGEVHIEGQNIIYTPNLNFTGIDRFDYIVCDNGTPIKCNEATITIFVTNTPPIAINDTINTTINNAINIEVLLNDFDTENGDLSVSLDNTHFPANGVIKIEGNTIRYIPSVDFNGYDQFNYIVCDDGNPILCDTAMVFVNVRNSSPIANTDTVITTSNTTVSIDVLSNDIDPDGGILSIAIDSTLLPSNGTVSIDGNEIVFVPTPSFTGIDSMAYIICDNGIPILCDTALVYIEVGNIPPNAMDDSAIVAANTSVVIPVQDNDQDTGESNLTTQLDSLKLPLNGQVVVNGTDLIYIPNLNFTGIDRFDYILCDDGDPMECSRATVSVIVENTRPIAQDDSIITSTNNAVTIPVQTNDNDPENGVLITNLDPTNLPINGVVSLDGNSIIYTPIENYSGADQFYYLVCDNGNPILCDTAKVLVTIVNNSPIALNDTASIFPNTPISIDVLNNDIDPDNGTLTISIDSTSLPNNGSVSVNDSLLIFTPIQGFTGTDSITYFICDDGDPSLCDTAFVLIEVANTRPIAADDTAKTGLNTPVVISIMANDIDPESDILKITIPTNDSPKNGAIVITTDSTFIGMNGANQENNYQIIYTPTDGFIGLDSFHYVICDNGDPVLCDTALVTIEIFNNAPIAVDDNIVTQEGVPITSSVLLNDFDPNNHPIITQLFTTPDKGTVTLDSSGQYTYLPFLYQNGTDSFTYSLCEAIDPFLCDTATVYIEIFPTNDPPIALNDINLTLENVSTVGNVLTNDFDPEGNEIFATTTLVTLPINGEVSLTADGDYIYRPNFLYLGNDDFSYEVCDDGIPSLCDTAQVIIEVIGTEGSNSRPPVGVNDYFQTYVNTPVSGDIISNDIVANGATLRINTEPVILPNEGILEISTIGSFFYLPALNKIGTETFTYEICTFEEPVLCETVLVQIDILPNIGNAIHATDDAASGLEDQVIRGNVLANDADPEGDDKFVQIAPIQLPAKGNVILQENGDFEYQPIKDYNGPDNFIYEVCDNGIPQACDRATVDLIIFPVPDTLCNQDITAPSILGTSSVCGNDSIYLFVQTDPAPLSIDNQNTTLEYIWYNGRGDTIAITNNRQLRLPVSPSTISPFSMRVRSGICTSPLSNLVPVEIVYLPEIFISINKNTDTLCANSSFQLSAPFVSSARYEWSRVGNPIAFSREQNVTIEDLSETTAYQLSVISEVCESISITRKTVYTYPTITNNNPPTIALQDNSTCGNNTLILNANIASDSTSTYQVEWTGPNNYTSFMAIDSIQSATTAANGQYTLVVTDRNSCETTSKIQVTEVTPSVTKPIITSAEGPVCENGNILLQAPSYEGKEADFTWYKNGVAIEDVFTNQLFIDDAQLRDTFSFTLPLEDCTLKSNIFIPIVFEKPNVTLDSAFQLYCSTGTENIVLNTNIEGGQTPYDIEWTGPNNFFSTNPNPTILNASAINSGTYTLLVTEQNGCITDVNTVVDIVDNLPTPILALSGSTCDGAQLELSAINYDDRSVSYEWNVPDSTGIPSLTSSTIRFPEANEQYKGAYILTANSGTCTAQSDTFYLEDFNILSATPEAIYEKETNCAAANLELFANATGTNLVYQWTGPNGFTSNLMNPVITNANTDNNGIYELSISNAQGCSIVAATNIIDNIQNGFPEPVLQSSGLICAGGFITLTAPVYTGSSVSYTWLENGNKLDNENGPTLVAGPLQTDGIEYELVVEVDDCILRSDPYFADVIEEIDLELDYLLSSNCGAEELQLIANLSIESTNFNFEWTGPAGFTSEVLDASIAQPIPENNGLYTLKISNESGCESSATLLINNIVSPPDAPIIKLISNECDTVIQLIVENEHVDANYSWTDKDGTIIGNSTQLNLNNTVAENGPYQVAISVDGCEVISSLPYSIESIDQAVVQIGNSGPVCFGTNATLFATNLEGYNYEWYNEREELIATESSTTISEINEATTYTLVVTKDGCSNEQTYQTEVLIETIPEISNITKSETYCEGESIFLTAQNKNPKGALIRYTWTGPNGFSYKEESTTDSFNLTLPSINISQAGSYTLQIETPNGCTSETNSVLVNVIPGIVAPALAVEQNAVCAGSTLSLEARSTAVTAIAYEWYLQKDTETPTLIATTDLPNYIIENATSDNSGTYIVKVVNEKCTSNFSNQVPVLVFDVNSDISILSSATDTKPGCYGDVLQLSLPFYPNASYRWFGPAGFTSTAYNPIIESLKEIHEGEYFAIIEMEGCQEVMTNPVNVIVNPKPAIPTAINSGPICIGNDLEFQVSSIVENGTDIRFDWFNSSDLLIGSTDNPLKSFNNVPALFNDQYYVKITIDGCTSPPSPSMSVQVNDPAALQANTGEDQEFCATAKITLAANPPLFGEGTWSSITGGSFNNSNLATTEVSQLQKGTNQFIWTVKDEVCGVQEIDTVNIIIGNVTSDQAIAGVDQDLCEEYTTMLTATPITESTGRWVQSAAQAQQGVQIGSPTSSQTSVIGLEAGNSYTFNWIISQADCPDFESDEIIINVNDIPEEYAIIQEEIMYLCGASNTNLDAELPGLSTGQWSYLNESDTSATPANNPIKIAAATNASTFVEGIPSGDNTFIWSLSNGACKDFSTDTIHILGDSELIASPDEYVINVNDSIAIDILENDNFDPEEPYEVIIVKYPNFGNLIENGDGTYMYQPINNYFGRDDFNYLLCDPNCESLCDTASVSLVVNGIEGSGACFIPNVISPNKDGNNDNFTVACIDDFPDNQLSIFNRWGDKVYTAAPYQNDWSGTHEGNDLPAGTYFYILQLSDQGEPLQGFITIFR